MKYFIIVFGFFIVLAGLLMMIDPKFIYYFLEQNSDSRWLYIVAIVSRVILGTFLILTAKQSKFPVVMNIIGFIALIAALIFLFIGQTNFTEFMNSVIPEVMPFARIWSLVAVGFGALMIYAYKKKEAEV